MAIRATNPNPLICPKNYPSKFADSKFTFNFASQSTFKNNDMDKHQNDIEAIREMMERSSKFLSLSGLSGIVAGVAAVAGVAFAHFYLLRDPGATDWNFMDECLFLLAVAVGVLIVAVSGGIYFSWRKARKRGEKLFGRAARLTIYSMAVPLVAGGVFCLISLLRGNINVAVSGSLLFYGLALVSASKYTRREIHSLGLVEIGLGLATMFLDWYGSGLLLWSVGFGLCHIVYGIVMYFKYDRAEHN
jgi:hypothetical protein